MKIRNLLFGFVLAMILLCASVSVNETKATAAQCPITTLQNLLHRCDLYGPVRVL